MMLTRAVVTSHRKWLISVMFIAYKLFAEICTISLVVVTCYSLLWYPPPEAIPLNLTCTSLPVVGVVFTTSVDCTTGTLLVSTTCSYDEAPVQICKLIIISTAINTP